MDVGAAWHGAGEGGSLLVMELVMEMDALIPCAAVPRDINYRKQVPPPPAFSDKCL